ncbi:hypothetical protein scyTo_0025911 [Scyliorhinus torazame]|uniref:Uncharacterized protein n=1 Tax=Scyliorhinus torazame TaxID=75743 RepID=A0A401QIS6_SCYTO|nr:hypothetical protein [Scyliorhinus torazame]
MKGKFEDEKERLIAEQTDVINHKLAEGERYSSEGFQEDQKRNEEESKYYKQEREKEESRGFWDHFRHFISWLGRLFLSW